MQVQLQKDLNSVHRRLAGLASMPPLPSKTTRFQSSDKELLREDLEHGDNREVDAQQYQSSGSLSSTTHDLTDDD